MKTKMIIGALSLASLVGVSATVRAQEHPCMADAARLCADIEPGGGAQTQCLKAHKDELSPACKHNVMAAKIKHEEQKQLEQQEQQQPPAQPPQ